MLKAFLTLLCALSFSSCTTVTSSSPDLSTNNLEEWGKRYATSDLVLYIKNTVDSYNVTIEKTTIQEFKNGEMLRDEFIKTVNTVGMTNKVCTILLATEFEFTGNEKKKTETVKAISELLLSAGCTNLNIFQAFSYGNVKR